MDDLRSRFSIYFFIIVLLIVVIGGYFLMDYYIKNLEDTKVEEVEVEEIADIRIDKDKDYIYFINEKVIIEHYQMDYKEIVINIPGHDNIETKLNNEIKELDKNIVLENNQEDLEDAVYRNDEEIYSASHRNYEIINYKEYITLIVTDFTFNVTSFIEAKEMEVYTFSKETGKIITEEEILSSNSITLDAIKSEIQSDLEKLNSGEDKFIDIDSTINNFDNYGIYLNKVGALEITYFIKSSEGDYFDNKVFD